MKKIAVKYIGWHQPNTIVEVNETMIHGLMKRKDYVFVDEKKNVVVEKKETVVNVEPTKEVVVEKEYVSTKIPKMYWTEKEILKWITDNNVDVKYEPEKHTKKEVFEMLKTVGVL